MNRTPRVAAVFVNYRAPELVKARVSALANAGIPSLVVDNSGDLGATVCPVVAAPANVGFGAACNMGVDHLDDDIEVVCLHNPDVLVEPIAIQALAVHAWGSGGAVVPALRTHGRIRARGFHYPTAPREAYVAARATALGASRRGFPTRPRCHRPIRHAERRDVGSGRVHCSC